MILIMLLHVLPPGYSLAYVSFFLSLILNQHFRVNGKLAVQGNVVQFYNAVFLPLVKDIDALHGVYLADGVQNHIRG